MTAVLIALNVIAGLFLVGVVLLQAGKGADMGAAFGGANPAAFGPAAQGNVLQKITAATAALFMGTSLALAIVSSRQESVFDGMAEPPPVAAPVAPVVIPGVDSAPVDVAAPGGVAQGAAEQAPSGDPVAQPADAAGSGAPADSPPSSDAGQGEESAPAPAEETAPAP